MSAIDELRIRQTVANWIWCYVNRPEWLQGMIDRQRNERAGE